MTATECSKWAVNDLSAEITVHWSRKTRGLVCPDQHHRFDGDGHAGTQRDPVPGVSKIRNHGALVHLPAHAMTGVFAGDVEATAFHITLDRRRDIAGAIANAHLLDRRRQARLR